MASDNVVIQAILDFKDKLTTPMKKAEKSISEVKEEIRQLNNEMARFRVDALKKKLDALRSGKTTGGLLDVTKSLQSMGQLVIGANIVQGLAQISAAAFTAGEEVRKGALALETITGSTQNAAAAMSSIQEVALSTGSTIADTTNAYIAMANRGIAPTAETLTAFANVAAGSNKSMIQFTEAVADAVTGEYERLKEFGIKVTKDGDRLNVNFKGQTKQIGNSSAEIQKFLTDIGKVEFAGAAEKQTKTISAQLSILSQNFISAASGPNAFYTAVVDGLAFVNKNFQSFVDEVGGYVSSFARFFTEDIPNALNVLLRVTGQDLNSISTFWKKVWNDIIGYISPFTNSLWGIISDTRQWGVAFVVGLVDVGISIRGVFSKISTGVIYIWDKMIYEVTKSLNVLIGYINKVGDSAVLKKFNLSFTISEVDLTAPEKLAERIRKLDEEIRRQRELNERAGMLWSDEIAARNKRRLESLRDERDILKKNAEEVAKSQAAITTANEKNVKSVDKIKDSYYEASKVYEENASKLRDVQAALVKLEEMKVAGSISSEKYAAMHNSLTEESIRLQKVLAAGATTATTPVVDDKKRNDELQQANKQLKQYEETTKTINDQVGEHFKEGARSIQSAISDALFDTLEGRAVNFGRTLISIFNRIASEILASTVFQVLLGDYGSGSSQVGGLFGSLFGGARAAGGPVNSNKAYLVGEKGPELFVPKSNGSIIPNGSFGTERPVYVTIQAVDTQSFQDALSRNSRWLTDMVNATSRRYNLGRA